MKCGSFSFNSYSEYFHQWMGVDAHTGPLPRPAMEHLALSWVGAFVGIVIAAGMESWIQYEYGYASKPSEATYLAGSFGAMAILVYGVPSGPLSQPRNIIVGQIISVLIGIASRKLFGIYLNLPWLAKSIGVSFSLLSMQLVRAVHPPAGGTALIAAGGGGLIDEMGWFFVVPVIVTSSLLLLVALIVNNVSKETAYPSYWFFENEKPREVVSKPIESSTLGDVPSKPTESISKATASTQVSECSSLEII